MAEEKEIVSSCNKCVRDTSHSLLHTEAKRIDHPDSYTEDRTLVVRCKGCGDISVRKEHWDFDYDSEACGTVGSCRDVDFDPPRIWWRPPDWLEIHLFSAAPELTELLQEIYSAANDRQSRLLAMGVRTALDRLMTEIVGDIGEFGSKLTKMVDDEHLTVKQREMLETVIDAGSAAAHRSFKPSKELLQEMIVTMETLVRDHYVTGPMLKTLKSHIPPRPPRKKPADKKP